MYDNNGLELSQMNDTLNTYLYTAMNVKTRKVVAYAPIRLNTTVKFGMITIGFFTDPRDAAFVAQSFNKLYTKEQSTQMSIDGTFREVAKDFIANLEIPEWEFEAEGLSFDDITGEGERYMFNYVNNARDALKEAVKKFNVKVPSLEVLKKLEAKVDALVKSGASYRAAAILALEI